MIFTFCTALKILPTALLVKPLEFLGQWGVKFSTVYGGDDGGPIQGIGQEGPLHIVQFTSMNGGVVEGDAPPFEHLNEVFSRNSRQDGGGELGSEKVVVADKKDIGDSGLQDKISRPYVEDIGVGLGLELGPILQFIQVIGGL